MLVFQVATVPGDQARPNEDFAGVLGDCAVLLDGSGAPGGLPTGCVHGVPWFVRQIGSRCLAAMAAGDPATPLADILAAAIHDTAARHAGTCDLTVPGTPSGMVVMARAGEDALDYLVLGDSALAAELGDGTVEVVTDRRMELVAADEYKAVLALPIGTPEHQAARIAYVRRQQPMRNQPGGYPVASTAPGAAALALTGRLADVRRAAMLTDGLTRYAEFGLGTWGDLLGCLSACGPAGLIRRVREAEVSDPDGRQWPRAKRHDDAGVVFWEGA